MLLIKPAMEEEESLLIFHYWYFTVLKINVVHM